MDDWDRYSPGDAQSTQGAWEKLSQVAVSGAEYNSRERQPHPKCLKRTRVKLLDHMYGSLDNQEKSRFFWLHGMAGVGKSAIAFTVAERMRGLKVKEAIPDEKRLAGTFFFSRKYTNRCTTGHFFPTLAYQLAGNFPSIREDVSKAIRDNPSLLQSNKSLRDQMEALFLKPLRRLRLRLTECLPVVFIVDALDECTSEAEAADLISLLGQALRAPDLPVIHILLTSRSEAHLREAIDEKEVRPLVHEIPVDASGEGPSTLLDVDSDIRVFLEDSFTRLRIRYPDFPQPTDHDLGRLASRAGARFIVASTMMKFIDDGYHDPRDRLQLILELKGTGMEVYKLYDLILSNSTDPKRAYLHLSIVAALANPLPISQISQLLGPGQGKDVKIVLEQLQSIIEIPTDTDLPVNIYHSSARDYVLDPSNCSLIKGQDITSPHSLLAYSSFRLMIGNIPESADLLDALLKLKTKSKAIESHHPQKLRHSLAFIIEPPTALGVLIPLIWLRGGCDPQLYSWLETLNGCAWLRTLVGRDWLETWGGLDWLKTQAGLGWLETMDGKDWLQPMRGSNWLQSGSGKDWLQLRSGRAWLKSRSGRAWLWSRSGRDWLRAQSVRDCICMLGSQISQKLNLKASDVNKLQLPNFQRVPDGQSWLDSPDGNIWLQTRGGQHWLPTPGGRHWLQSSGGQHWLQSSGGQDWLQTPGGREWLDPDVEWLKTKIQEWLETNVEWLKTKIQEWLPKCLEGAQELVESMQEWLESMLESSRVRGWLESMQEWLESPSPREWLKSIREWLESPSLREWLESQNVQEWLQEQLENLNEWLHTHSIQEWLQLENLDEWLRSLNLREWLQGSLFIPSIQEWLESPSIQVWLYTPSIQVWLHIQSALQTLGEWSEWLESSAAKAWLLSPSGISWGKTLLQTSIGALQESLEMSFQMSMKALLESLEASLKSLIASLEKAKVFLQTSVEGLLQSAEGLPQSVCAVLRAMRVLLQTIVGAWLERPSVQEWLQAGVQRWLQTSASQWTQASVREVLENPNVQRMFLEDPTVRMLVEDPTVQRFLETRTARNFLHVTPSVRELPRMREWLQTPNALEWLQTPSACELLQGPIGQGWLQTSNGQEWLQTSSAQEWLQTPSAHKWLQTPSAHKWFQTESGREWLQAPSAREWVQTPSAREWLQTLSMQEWLKTPSGHEWLHTPSGRAWLQNSSGREWLQTPSIQEWLKTPSGHEWLHTPSGREWLQNSSGREWLQTPNMLKTPSGHEWLRSPRGREWLLTQGGREWLQTPHGQAWQSTPAASFWVYMEEFLDTVATISKFIIIPELSLLPAFQIIQEFKNLPDFLMFPAFLALTPRTPTSVLPHGPDMEIIHVINTFVSFTDEARERSRSASYALIYACQNWAMHLARAPNPWDEPLNDMFKVFWEHHLLSWLERLWCMRGLRSCLIVLSEGQKLAKEHFYVRKSSITIANRILRAKSRRLVRT